MEQWRAVVGYEDFYEVSDCGRLRRNGRKLRKTQIVNGYVTANLSKNGRVKKCKLHIMVAEAFIRPRPIGLTVNHKDGQKVNNIPTNLEWASMKENNMHAYESLNKRARLQRGSAHYSTKLSDDDVREIRRLRDSDVPLNDIASKFKISFQNVSTIAKRHTWKHI